MEQNKEKIIRNLRRGSICFTAACFILMLVNLSGAVLVLMLEPFFKMQAGTRFQAVEISTVFAINALCLLLAALMFVRIAKDSRPFTPKNVRAVRSIGILFLLGSFCPALAGNLITGFVLVGNMEQRYFRPNMLIAGLILLFVAYIMHYGAALQQESDETL